VVRLVAAVQFVRPDASLSERHHAVVDTGAPWSVLPRYIWQPLKAEIHTADTHFGGINKLKVCQIPAAAGMVRGRLLDAVGNATGVRTFPAYLAKSDGVPLILGFAGLLEELGVYFNYQTGEAWVEEQ
jgi:predicted aspartyl protease